MPEPSEWQSRIEGEWHGRPSLLDATGTWRGYEDIRRSSVFEDGVTTYYMDGGLEGGGPLAGRFRLGAPFAFGVTASDSELLSASTDRPASVARPVQRPAHASGSAPGNAMPLPSNRAGNRHPPPRSTASAAPSRASVPLALHRCPSP